MSSQSATTNTAPARQAVRLVAALRAHRCDVARWALGAGRPLNLDAITVILGARSFEASVDGHPFTWWTGQSIITFTWGTAAQWCNNHGVELPPTTAESLFTYLAFLADTNQLAKGSSSRRSLLETVIDVSGLASDGRRRTSAANHATATTAPTALAR